MQKIPMINLQKQEEPILPQIKQAIERVIARKDFILGEEVELFEKDFAQFCDAKYAIGVASGTDALHLSLRACGIGEGDEVIVPTFTFIATALAVSYSGARPVFVDVSDRDYAIDLEDVEKKITSKTKAIIPVHLFGNPLDMDKVCQLAYQHGLKVIEDACQAHGAKHNGKHVGTFGNAGCFSFYPSKNLGCYGDGGMIITSDTELANRLRVLRDCGRETRAVHGVIGYNSRLDTIQAAILRVKLKELSVWNKRRQEIAKMYREHLQQLCIVLPPEEWDDKCVYHQYVIRHKERDKILKALTEKGIGAAVHYPIPLHLQKAYQDLGYKIGNFPCAEKLSGEVLSLPMCPILREEDIDVVTEALRS